MSSSWPGEGTALEMEKHLDLKNELLLVLSEVSAKMKIKSTSYFCTWGGSGKIAHAQSSVGELLTGEGGSGRPVRWLPRGLRRAPSPRLCPVFSVTPFVFFRRCHGLSPVQPPRAIPSLYTLDSLNDGQGSHFHSL